MVSSRFITDSGYDGYETQYPKLLELSDKQIEKQMWFASETKVIEEDRLGGVIRLTDKQQNVLKAIMPMFRKYRTTLRSLDRGVR